MNTNKSFGNYNIMFNYELLVEAQFIIKRVGSEKESTQKRRKEKEQNLSHREQINESVSMICRAVGRHPDSEVMKQVYFLFFQLKTLFLKDSDEAIDWLLGGSAKTSRGGFQNSDSKTRVQKFREFFQTDDPISIPHQKLINKIETILTAMAYRAINMPEAEIPIEPKTEDQKLIHKKINALMKYRVKPIKDIYFKQDDVIENNLKIDEKEIVFGKVEEDISSGSEQEEEEDKRPRETQPTKIFRKYIQKKDKILSWPGSAKKGNLDQIQTHVSGTAPLIMAVIAGLYDLSSETNDWLSSDENFKKLCGLLIIATFKRAGYHSLSEVIAGIWHYLKETAKKENKPLHPYDAFCEGLSILKEACTNQVLDKNDKMSLQKAVSILNDDIIKHVKKITVIDFKIRVPIKEEEIKELNLMDISLEDINWLRNIDEIDQIIADAFTDIEDLVIFISEAKQEIWQEILLMSAPKLVEKLLPTSNELKIFFSNPNLNAKQTVIVCDVFKDILPKIINKIENFKNLMSFHVSTFTDVDKKSSIFHSMKDQLPMIIKTGVDFNSAVVGLNVDCRDEIKKLYDLIKNDLIIKSLDDVVGIFVILFQFTNEEPCNEAYKLHKDILLSFNDSKAFDKIRVCLTSDSKKDLFETLLKNNKLLDLIPDFYCFGDIVCTLQSSAENVTYLCNEMLKKKISPEHIRELLYLWECLASYPELQKQLCGPFMTKEGLSKIIKNEWDMSYVDEFYDESFKNSVEVILSETKLGSCFEMGLFGNKTQIIENKVKNTEDLSLGLNKN